jgi:MFS transporter, CP family, cyanate transporter
MTAAARDGRRLALLWLVGMDLRLTILALPPLLPLIHDDLGLNETAVAALTGLPVLLFALIAVPGALLIARFGAHRAAVLGILAVALGSALRGVGPSAPMLFAMTFVMGAGVSVIHPALPGLVGQWFGTRPAFATAVYANGLLMGEVLGAGLTRPVLLPLAGGRWEWAFALWAVPVLLTGLLMIGSESDARGTSARANNRWWPDWRHRHTWQLGLVQGGGSVLYFGCNAFLPDYLDAIGRLDLLNACLTTLNAGQLPASFVLLLLGDRLAGRKTPFIAAALFALLGLAGLFVPLAAVMIAASALIGFVAALVLILTLALPPLLAPPGDVHRLSAGVMTIAYGLTFVVPLLGGIVWDATAMTALAFLPAALGALTVLVLAAMLEPVTRRR